MRLRLRKLKGRQLECSCLAFVYMTTGRSIGLSYCRLRLHPGSTGVTTAGRPPHPRARTSHRPYYATNRPDRPIHSRGDPRSGPEVGHHGARLLALPLFISLALLLFPLPSSAHAAAGTGRIYGQLLDGTKRNAPLADQSITLQMAQGDTSRDLTSVATDAHGTFSFSGLNTDKTINYALYMLYQGAQYYTDLIDLSTKHIQQINLTVYDATASIANIAIVQAN